MTKGKKVILLLTTGLVIVEMAVFYLHYKEGYEDLTGSVSLLLLFLLFILLFAKGFAWARWILSILLFVNGLLYFLSGLLLFAEGIGNAILFSLFGLFEITFAVLIHRAESLSMFRLNANQNNEHVGGHEAETFNTGDQVHRYPLLVKRYKALLIDAVLLLTVLVIIMLLVDESANKVAIKVTSGVLLLITYEPILTAYSRTIGQRIMGIRVGNYKNPSERINLVNAYVRWITKALLGWVSFITISFNPAHRAIHDMASNSVMTMAR